jgi:hypothetical protein
MLFFLMRQWFTGGLSSGLESQSLLMKNIVLRQIYNIASNYINDAWLSHSLSHRPQQQNS